MDIYTFLNLNEFEDLCLLRLGNSERSIKTLRSNMEHNAAQSYAKSVQEIDNIINNLMRVKLDIENVSTRLTKEISNDKN